MLMYKGKTNNYFWIEGCEINLDDLILNCPGLFLGKTVAITAFDGGPIEPNDNEKKLGWYAKDNVFYATDISRPKDIPNDQYDEWYIFDELKEFRPTDAFVNYGSFSLKDPNHQMVEADPTWDKVGLQQLIDTQQEMQLRFWEYVRRISPRSFLMDGSHFMFGSIFEEDIKYIIQTMQERRIDYKQCSEQNV